MAGPIIGSALYAVLGYEHMFYVYGSAEAVFALAIRFLMPLPEEDENEAVEQEHINLVDGQIKSNRIS